MLNHNNGIQFDIIFTGFAKAFDKVPHQRLLYKVKWYGIDNNIYHTRLASGNKLLQTRSPDNSTSNFYFNRLPRIWNALPIINYQDNPLKIKAKLLDYLWNHFTANFTSNNTCSFSFLCPCSKCSKIPHQPNFNSL